ncbi:MAG TPA: two-component regulator propeller domain-containing protein, partial [Bacteroidia bacterium]|nr:two-component regulator propeller domain-containing protein [Bacteroidia bacterium]
MYTFRYRILYFCLLVFSAHAQTPFISDKSLVASNDFTIENWNSENGLPQNSVISMLQTRDGFLWLSTTNGLLRFDGKTFRNFNTSNTPGLQGTSFPVLFESRQGILWVINLSGKLFHYEEGEFQEVVFKGQEQAGFKSLCENKTGNLIACIGSNQVYEYAGGVFKPLLTLPVKTGNISQICCDGDELYLSTERRLYQYKNKLLSSIAGICDSVPTRMKQFEGQGIWVYNNNHFFRVKNGTCTPVPLPAALAGPIKLMDYYPDSGNRLWITCNKGLVCAGPQSYRFYGVNEGLSSELTSVICLDREGNIWAGTSEAGLNKMKHKTFFTYSRKDGLFADPTGALLLLKNKSLLVSNYCEGLNKIDQEGIRPFMKEHMGCIWALMKDKDSALWLGVYGDGVFRYHQEKWTHYTAAKDSLSGNIVFSLFQDSQGTVWIGTNNGICTWTNGHITPVLKTRITSPVTHILEDHLHRIWYGSSDGLGMISANNLTVYTTASGLSHNKVRYVYEDQEGIFWIATYGGGINRLKDGKLFSFHTLPGMIDEYTSAIQEDDSGNLWISSNRG